MAEDFASTSQNPKIAVKPSLSTESTEVCITTHPPQLATTADQSPEQSAKDATSHEPSIGDPVVYLLLFSDELPPVKELSEALQLVKSSVVDTSV